MHSFTLTGTLLRSSCDELISFNLFFSLYNSETLGEKNVNGSIRLHSNAGRLHLPPIYSRLNARQKQKSNPNQSNNPETNANPHAGADPGVFLEGVHHEKMTSTLS